MCMPTRIHIVVDERERAAFRARAAAEGRSLSEWLREAGRDRLRRGTPSALGTPEELTDFFRRCDEREKEGGEPDWEEHLEVIRASRGDGLPDR